MMRTAHRHTFTWTATSCTLERYSRLNLISFLVTPWRKTSTDYMDRVAYGGGDEATGDDALDILSIGDAVIQGM
jgi:hypothetical protein